MPLPGHFYFLSVCCFFSFDNLNEISTTGTIIIIEEAEAITIRQVLCSSMPLIMLFTFIAIMPTNITMISMNNIFGEPIFENTV